MNAKIFEDKKKEIENLEYASEYARMRAIGIMERLPNAADAEIRPSVMGGVIFSWKSEASAAVIEIHGDGVGGYLRYENFADGAASFLPADFEDAESTAEFFEAVSALENE